MLEALSAAAVVALLARRADAARLLQVLPLALGYAPALALHLDRGRAGRHESAV